MTQTNTLNAGDFLLANWAQAIRKSALQQMLTEASRPDIISFALGLPDIKLFPTAAYSDAVTQVLATDPLAMQYGPPFGPLKLHIVSLMKARGVDCKPEQIFLTTGAQQGLNLLARLLLDPGGQVIMEEMSYTGFQQVIEPFQPEILTVQTDLETGMSVDEVELLLRRGARPAFIYTVTDGHNPMAVCMSQEKRLRLVELARQYGVPIIEDDAYGFLYYNETPLPPMRALDDRIVLYVGTVSKILGPGLRVGWLVVPEFLIPSLSVVKEASDIDTSTFVQRTVSAYADQGGLLDHIAVLRTEYKLRRDTMINALSQHLPTQARWQIPTSGVFVWVELPDHLNGGDLLKISMSREQVAFVPGAAFCSRQNNHGANCIRLNFSHSAPKLIDEGVRRLARALKALEDEQ